MTKISIEWQTEMVGLNMYGEGNMACDACPCSTYRDYSHRCTGYAEVRDGLDLSEMKDLVMYFREVMVQR